jgi:hypothetical protein
MRKGSWSEWGPPYARIIRYAIAQGFTEADVRRFRRAVNRDVFEVQMHNWRKLVVSGRDLFTFDIPANAYIQYEDGLPRTGSTSTTQYVVWQLR